MVLSVLTPHRVCHGRIYCYIMNCVQSIISILLVRQTELVDETFVYRYAQRRALVLRSATAQRRTHTHLNYSIVIADSG
jgi:hypothetical protein